MCWASRASRPHNTTTQTLGPLLRRGKPGHLFFFFSFSQQCNTNKPAETQPDPAGSRAEGQHQVAPCSQWSQDRQRSKPKAHWCWVCLCPILAPALWGWQQTTPLPWTWSSCPLSQTFWWIYSSWEHTCKKSNSASDFLPAGDTKIKVPPTPLSKK